MERLNRTQMLIPMGLLFILGAEGCKKATSNSAPPLMPTVGVSKPIARETVDFAEFTGRTAAPQMVDIRPRVTGYIIKTPFVEGAEIKTDDLLFEIDPRPYQAQLDRSRADLDLNQAKLKLAKGDNLRAQGIVAVNAGAISKQDLDKYAAAEAESAAAVESSQASLEIAKINLEFTKVTSPIDGQVSRYNWTIGNLVNADTTVLTTVVSQNPMYTYFDIDEQTFLNVIRRMMNQTSDSIHTKTFPVLMGLGDEEGYPHPGFINFANNVVSVSTGTLTARGSFVNPPAPSGRRLLRPGMFVRIRLPLGKPRQTLLVSERSLGTDQGRKFLLLVDEKKTVKYARVTVGPLQDDGLRVIETGLSETDTVIVSGLQFVRSRMEVQTEDEPMLKNGVANDDSPDAGGKTSSPKK